ncbi:MAG: DUF2975 domain-containing protein [Prevotella sp.]|nr:DUF2975 domain-containing protein [Prevotella sp.]
MNKKLKIYSTLFIVTFIILAVTSTFHYNNYTWTGTSEEKLEFADCPPEFMSRDTLPSGTVITNRHLTMSYEVNVVPKDTPDRKVLLSKTKDQTYQVNMKKVDLGVPMNKVQSHIPSILILSTAVVVIIVAIWILVLVFKLIFKIRKGEIFVTKVSKYLETAGILLSGLYLFTLATSYITTQYFISHIQMADYYIVFKNECNGMYILTGLALMMISQIILMGKDLKEEQELTI